MSRLNKRKIAIPYCYVWMVEESKDPGRMFKTYVGGYVRNTHPGWDLVRIEKMNAIIKREGS
ncbi:hypothetical protein HLI_11805 [Halobacillus litoralis]|uniref:Uncharacterized protein n=1 Tax=Halobacillus litoralis TaxID=45668 RepID=A0A410MDM2_9BACI|nr:hypothetical protein HLI_11805 [Halobacillus litoralis]